MKRLLGLHGIDLAALIGDALAGSIRASEGRTIMAEVIAGAPPLIGVGAPSNAELVSAFGADLVCLNMIDPTTSGPFIPGLESVEPPPEGFYGLAAFLGRPVGLNLEPDLDSVPKPLRASPSNVRAAADRGAAFVMVTVNPGRGASTDDLARAVTTVRESAPDLLCFAGRMHLGGSDEPISVDSADRLLDAGAQGLLVPVPGTVPGVDEATAAEMVRLAHGLGALVVGTIGTSQEGADRETIRSLALTAKRIGCDVHHIGDGGYSGVAVPENIYAYSVAIRGVRHTWSRMAGGVRASWTKGAQDELS